MSEPAIFTATWGVLYSLLVGLMLGVVIAL